MTDSFLFTSESVSEGHPDKVCDQISDAVLDAILTQHKTARVACETLVKNNLIVLAGEITTTAKIDFDKVARGVVREIGYTDEMGFGPDSCTVLTAIGQQSPHIAQGVDEGKGLDLEQGAGDQGLMFGYATNETDVLMPMPITLAHLLVKRHAVVRKKGKLAWLRPDAKSQVTIRYIDGKPAGIDAVVLSTQHAPGISHKKLKEAVIEEIVKPVLPKKWLDRKTKYFINPTGAFEIGGPVGDAGVTGRKIIVAAGLAARCEIQIAYAIGIAKPVSVHIDTFGTGVIPDAKIAKIVRDVFDLRPKGIVKMLDLLKPVYQQTAAYGHFGRNEKGFNWERTDKAAALRSAAGTKARAK